MAADSRRVIQASLDELAARRSCVVATVVRHAGSVPRTTGAKMLVRRDGALSGTVGGGLFESLVRQDGLVALNEGTSRTRVYSFNPEGATPHAFGAICGGRADVFLEVLMPPDRLIIVGGGHCGRALAHAAVLTGFEVVVVDDREEFLGAPDFPEGVELIRAGAELSELPLPDERTYVALMSKGFVQDELALRRVIESPAAYIGMIGSVRKREVVFASMEASGTSRELLGRVHSPIGLEIGAETPAEIAISVLAEIIRFRARGAVAGRMSELDSND